MDASVRASSSPTGRSGGTHLAHAASRITIPTAAFTVGITGTPLSAAPQASTGPKPGQVAGDEPVHRGGDQVRQPADRASGAGRHGIRQVSFGSHQNGGPAADRSQERSGVGEVAAAVLDAANPVRVGVEEPRHRLDGDRHAADLRDMVEQQGRRFWAERLGERGIEGVDTFLIDVAEEEGRRRQNAGEGKRARLAPQLAAENVETSAYARTAAVDITDPKSGKVC